MTTGHGDDFEWRGEHVVQAERAVRVGGIFDTGMCRIVRDGYTDVAFLTGKSVFTSSRDSMNEK